MLVYLTTFIVVQKYRSSSQERILIRTDLGMDSILKTLRVKLIRSRSSGKEFPSRSLGTSLNLRSNLSWMGDDPREICLAPKEMELNPQD